MPIEMSLAGGTLIVEEVVMTYFIIASSPNKGKHTSLADVLTDTAVSPNRTRIGNANSELAAQFRR
jgi:hypothetical protein